MTGVIQLLIVLVVIAGSIILISIFRRRTSNESNKGEARISFKKSLDLSNLPIITFTCGGKRLNFLIDTGSSHSHISSSAKDALPKECIIKTDLANTMDVIGASGGMESQSSVSINLKYRSVEYPVEIYISKGLSSAFEYLKCNEGIQLHGILGNDFLDMYNYVIDFKDLVIYSKK